tara:strand:+ start:80 stop:412 length:333 start_codon:yes stop_codon:yes gene_type:complete
MDFKMKGFSGFGNECAKCGSRPCVCVDSPAKFCGPHSDFAKAVVKISHNIKDKIKTTKTKIKKKRETNKEFRKRKKNIRKYGNPYGQSHTNPRTLKSSNMRTYGTFEGDD